MISKDLQFANYSSTPFPHATSLEGLCPESATRLLLWLESEAQWQLVETSFYEQYEFSFRDIVLPTDVPSPLSLTTLNYLKSLMEKWFKTRLSEKIDVTAHKLVAGQRIRIHNDYIPGQETHRLLIQLNRGWIDENGGFLMLFTGSNPDDLEQVLRPAHNSCFAFEISPKSLHAVSTINNSERFTVVYSFYSDQ